MSHAVFIALLNNQTDVFNSVNLQQTTINIMNYLEQYISEFISFSLIVLDNLATKYTKTFLDLYIFVTTMILIYQNSTKISLNRVMYLENQVQFMKKRLQIQDGNIDYLLENKKHNDLKIATLKRHVQKVIKDNKMYA